jgi:hypothetical protein
MKNINQLEIEMVSGGGEAGGGEAGGSASGSYNTSGQSSSTTNCGPSISVTNQCTPTPNGGQSCSTTITIGAGCTTNQTNVSSSSGSVSGEGFWGGEGRSRAARGTLIIEVQQGCNDPYSI